MTTCIINLSREFSKQKYRQIRDAVIEDIKKDHVHKIPFNTAEHYATNTMSTVECTECLKPRMVYAATNIIASEKKNFHIVMGMLFTCGAIFAEFKSIDLNTKKAECLDKLFVRANLTCIKPIEALYYTWNYPVRCAHCGSKQSLQKTIIA